MKTKKTLRTLREVTQESIKNPEEAAAYLTAAVEDDDGRMFLIALKDIIEVHGSLSEMARKAHLNRGNLHRMLTGKSNPKFETVQKVLDATGFTLNVRPLEERKEKSPRTRNDVDRNF